MIFLACIGCFAAGAFAGLIAGFSSGRRIRQTPSPKPVCGCGHHLAYHDRKTGACNNYQPGVVQSGTDKLVKCKCLQYSGPEPLQEFYAPPLTDNNQE